MEIEGIKINEGFLKKLSEKFQNKIDKLEKDIFKISKKISKLDLPNNLVK